MLSRKELEEIIKAWPDKDGKSSNPEVYENWLEMQKQYHYDTVQILEEKSRLYHLRKILLSLISIIGQIFNRSKKDNF